MCFAGTSLVLVESITLVLEQPGPEGEHAADVPVNIASVSAGIAMESSTTIPPMMISFFTEDQDTTNNPCDSSAYRTGETIPERIMKFLCTDSAKLQFMTRS